MKKWNNNFKVKIFLLILFIPLISLGQKTIEEFELDFSALKKHKARYYKNARNILLESKQLNSPNRAYDAIYYKLKIKIYYDPDEIEGTVTIQGKPYNSELTVIELDFHDQLHITGVSDNVSSYTHDGFLLKITLDKPASPDSIFSFDVSYKGKPFEDKNSYFSFDSFPFGSRSVWTLSESYGARYWWPCKDSPKDKADSVDIIITVPQGQYAVSNGTLINTINHSDSTTFYWKETYPIVTYLVSLAIGNYANYSEYYHYGDNDSLLLDYYVYPENLDDAKEAFSGMHDFLDCFSYYFGDYPFLREKYGHVQFGWGGGMEHQTITSIGKVSSSIGWQYLYVHELGHQWFGDLVTCASWSDIWLNEGFASYSEALYAEWAGFYGYPPGEESYHAYINTQKYYGDRTIIVADTTDESNIFHSIVYDKGSWVLHMLRKIMGDEAFFSALRKYLHDVRWTYGSVTTENFKSICEKTSGLSLSTFFNQWLYYPFYPKYEYYWNAVNNKVLNQNDVEFVLLQSQLSPIYEMPIDLKICFGDGSDTTITIQNFKSKQIYKFNLNGLPVATYFDPDDWILKTSVEIPGEPYTHQISIKNIYPNPSWKNINIEVTNWDFNHTKLQIYNILGKAVATIYPIGKRMYTDYYLWDGKNSHGVRAASGTYILRPVLETDGQNRKGISKKLILIH